jgi:hypothetical protein
VFLLVLRRPSRANSRPEPASRLLDDFGGKVELSTQQLRNLITLLVSDEFWTITGL